MKRKMPKVLLTLAVACMLVIGAVAGSMTRAYADDTTGLPDDYIAYFTFDGTLADETGNYTATAVGQAFSETSKTADDWTYAEGTADQAVVINDNGDLVGLNTGINITSGQSYSISFAAKASSAVFATPIVWIGNTDQSTDGEHWHGFWAGFDADWTDLEQVGLGSNSNDTGRLCINPNVSLNDATSTSFDWTVITWTFDATDNTITLYYDGLLVGSAEGFTDLTDDAYIYIGANAWDSPAESLTIDELYVYDYVIYEEEENAIVSVDVAGDLSTDEFTTGDKVNLDGTEIVVTYEDGMTETLTLGEDYSYGAIDSCGNYIEYFLYSYLDTYEDEDGESWTDHDSYSYGSTLRSGGTYKVGFFVYDIEWNYLGEYLTDTEVTVNLLSVSDITEVTELTLDETYTAEIEEYGAYVWYSFTPETSGYYTFMSSNNGEGDDYIDPYVELYVSYDGETMEYVTYRDDYNDTNFYLRTYLEVGATYYYKAKAYGDQYVGVYDVTLFNKTITDISVSTLTQTELTQSVTEFDLTGTEVTVTYSDGSTAVLTIDGNNAADEYENYIYYYISVYVEDGDDSWYDWYYGGNTVGVAGEYPVYFYDSYTGITSEALTITVKSIEEADSDEITEIELLDEEVTVEATSETAVWFSFTPAATSTYYVVTDYTLTTELEDDQEDASYIWYNVYYLDEDGELAWVEQATDEDGNYLYDEDGNELYVLTEGVTYYIRLYFEGRYSVYVEEYDEDWYTYDDEMGAYVTVSVQEVDHTHTYEDAVITWTWSEDYASATAVLRCDTCSHTETGTATITSVTTDATATTAGSIVYTATVTIGGVEYTDTVTVEIPATGDTNSTSGDGTGTSSTGSTSPKTGDVSTVGYCAVLLFAAAAIAVLAKKRANA